MLDLFAEDDLGVDGLFPHNICLGVVCVVLTVGVDLGVIADEDDNVVDFDVDFGLSWVARMAVGVEEGVFLLSLV